MNAPVDPERELALIEGLRRGDRRDCEQLVRLHRPRMLAVARRILGGDQGAEDCVQDALISALREIHRFEGRSSLATWLHRITVNAALMSLRARRRRNEEPIEELLPQFDSNDCRIEPLLNVPERPDTLYARSEIRALVRRRIDELPESYRIVLVLRDIEELDTAEVAELLGATETAVKVRLHRARAALKKLLEPIWLEGLK